MKIKELKYHLEHFEKRSILQAKIIIEYEFNTPNIERVMGLKEELLKLKLEYRTGIIK